MSFSITGYPSFTPKQPQKAVKTEQTRFGSQQSATPDQVRQQLSQEFATRNIQVDIRDDIRGPGLVVTIPARGNALSGDTDEQEQVVNLLATLGATPNPQVWNQPTLQGIPVRVDLGTRLAPLAFSGGKITTPGGPGMPGDKARQVIQDTLTKAAQQSKPTDAQVDAAKTKLEDALKQQGIANPNVKKVGGGLYVWVKRGGKTAMTKAVQQAGGQNVKGAAKHHFTFDGVDVSVHINGTKTTA